MNRVDLHTHTTASDGKNTPMQDVQFAKERGLTALAITDHDTVSVVQDALQFGKKLGIKLSLGLK